MSHNYRPTWLPRAALSVLAFGVLLGGTWCVRGYLSDSRAHNAIAPSSATQSASASQALPAPASPAAAQAVGQSRAAITPKVVNSAPEATVVDLPEAKLRITLPDSVKDLTYTSDTVTLMNGVTVTQVSLSTTTAETADSACSAAEGALGVLTKGDGQYPSSDPLAGNLYGVLIKQFPSYFISYSRPQAACSIHDNELNSKVAAAQKVLLKAAQKGEQVQ